METKKDNLIIGLLITIIIILIVFIGLILSGVISISKDNESNDNIPTNDKVDNSSNTNNENDYLLYENGTAIYYDATNGRKCNASDASSTAISGCLKFYAFLDKKENDKVNLILDHDVSASTFSELGWKNEVRSISAMEIVEITGNKNWNFETAMVDDYYYLDTNSTDRTYGTNKFSWLFENTENCKEYGCLTEEGSMTQGYPSTGYLTSTIFGGTKSWAVTNQGMLRTVNNQGAGNEGRRPVISISKDILK